MALASRQTAPVACTGDEMSDGTAIYERGSGAARADEAPRALDGTTDADPHVRQEALLDEAVEETFPASDPVSVVRIL